MVSRSAVDLLLVNADPAVSNVIEGASAVEQPTYRWRHAGSREAFFESLDSRQPDLIFLSERGVPRLAPQEVLALAQKPDSRIPVVVLGIRRRPQSVHPLLWQGASDYLRLAEIGRLPMIIERMRRERQFRIDQMRLQNDLQRVADLLRENQRLVTVGRLTGSIAHEINNPLESVTNLLFLIEHEPGLSEAAKTYVEMAQREMERVVQISKQTLNFCREASAPVSLRLVDLLDQVLVLYTHRIAQKGLRVIRQFEEQKPITILPGEMRQVFSNLIINAIEASSAGDKLVLRVRKSRLWGDSGVVGQRVTIADTGAGMPPEVRRRVGEAFFTTKGQSGTGLGLWVTQSIIQRYGGNLFLYSSTGKHHGTVFSLFLPTNLRPRAVSGSTESTLAKPTIEMGTARGERRRPSRPRAKGA